MKILSGIFIGILLAVLFYETRPTEIPEKTKSEFVTLSLQEAKTYAEAKTPEGKLRAAEELYGRMMVLFLANLGLELQKSSAIEVVKETEPEAVNQTSEKKPVLVTKQDVCTPCAGTTDSLEKKKKEAEKLTTPEKFKSSSYLNQPNRLLRNLRGVFVGKLSHFAGSRRGKTDSALIDVDLLEKEGGVDGKISVILTDDNGTPYSRNQGKGGNKTIRYNDKDQMVYVEASPNSFFSFRVREFNRNEIRGEFFEDDALVGKSVLFRQ